MPSPFQITKCIHCESTDIEECQTYPNEPQTFVCNKCGKYTDTLDLLP